MSQVQRSTSMAWGISIGLHLVAVAIVLWLWLRQDYRQPTPTQQTQQHTIPVKLMPTHQSVALHAVNRKTVQQQLEQRLGKALTIERKVQLTPHLQAYLVHLNTNPEAKSFIYNDPSADYYFIGTAFSVKTGHNLSLQATERYIQAKRNKKLLIESKNLTGIWQGDPHNAHIVTIIIDPNSPLFPVQYNDLQYDVLHGEFSIRWVLVDYLKPHGPNAAGIILDAAKPAVALNYAATHYNKSTQTAGLLRATGVLSQRAQHLLNQHWQWVQRYQLHPLPITLFYGHAKHAFVITGVVLDEAIEMAL